MKILVVCSSNICRSPYAEFMLRKMISQRPILKENIEWVKSSAVFNKSFKISPKTKLCLLEEGFPEEEINNHNPTFKWCKKDWFEEADVIIGMTKSHKVFTPKKYRDKFRTLTELAYGKYIAIPDPYLETEQGKYNECMLEIKKALVSYCDNLEDEFNNKKTVSI